MSLCEEDYEQIVTEAVNARRKARKHLADIRKEAEELESDKFSKSLKGVWFEGGVETMRWTHAPYYMDELMPDHESYARLGH